MTLLLHRPAPPDDAAWAEIVDRLSRREFTAGGAALAALLAACGGDDDASTADTEQMRLVPHQLGAVEVPADPRRMLILHEVVLANALAVGLPIEHVAGVTLNTAGIPTDLSYLRTFGKVAKLKTVGTVQAPNVEAVAALEPDLILAFGRAGSDLATEQKKTYAETGLPLFTALNGYETVDQAMQFARDVGVAPGRGDAAEEVESDFRAKVAALRNKLPSKLPSVATIRSFADGSFWANANPLFHELGLPRHTSVPGGRLGPVLGRASGGRRRDFVFAYGVNVDPSARLPVPTMAAG